MINKIKINVNEIQELCKKHETDMDHFWVNVQKRFNISVIQKAGDRQKRCGISISILFETAIAMPILLVGTIQSFFGSQFNRIFKCGKSAFYRFHQDSQFNWRKVLYYFNRQIEKNEQQSETIASHPKVLILDDSTITKTGKKIEGVSRVHDHTDNSYPIGYKLLGLTWFNGFYGRFLDFCLVAEKKIKMKKTKKQFSKKRDKKST